MKFLLIILCCLVGSLSFGQDISKAQLEKFEDEELLDYFNEVSNDSIHAELVARVYLERGRAEGDTIKMARGYDRLARIFNPSKNIQFADSVITLTKNIDHITYPALGYLIKGAYYGSINDIENEMNNYLKCYDLAYKNNNQIQQAWILHQLIIGKSIWGNKMEALELQYRRDSLINTNDYYENLKTTTRLNSAIDINELKLINKINSYSTFSFIYLRINRLDSVNKYLKLEKEFLKNYQADDKLDYELSLLKYTIETRYKERKYNRAIVLADSVLLNTELDQLSQNQLFNLYSIIGFSEIKIKNYERGYRYLEKCDSLTKLFVYEFYPDDRLIFEKLLKRAEINNNFIKQIEYLNKLIEIDSVFLNNYKYYDPNMLKRFDIPRLIEEKEKLVFGLTTKNNNKAKTIWIACSILFVALIALIYYFNRQKVFRKRYEALMLKKTPLKTGVITLHSDSVSNSISPEIISEILDKLDRFERNKQFLSMDINLNGLAKKLQTNQNYLSRVVNLKMEKNFSQYLSDLRIEYALEELKSNSVFRKYSVKAIANECGFKTSESFSKAFYKEVGIYPSYYIKKLEKEKDAI
jgi:AraC-like DNA-binding protein